ncbi:heavy metal translocating P-type ATPase [Roseomonas eburnea]|uniref:P-type Zn(2+) transporter n=2 Tax=Neoroseomonas eburnea TaxID=1346889 RepID=A0A9X9XG29_9PROT|nr:heavy metal translocating P-type ATPase [Neoroseomonas eburnea]
MTRLDLAVLLPDAPDARDACVRRLVSEIEGRPGIARVHVLPAGAGVPAQICIHHDAALLEVARLRELALAAGARLTERYGHVVWEVDGTLSARRARRVAEALGRLPGVLEAEAAPGGPVRIEFDRGVTDAAALEAALAGLRLRRTAPDEHEHDHDHAEAPGHAHDHDHDGPFGANSEMIFAIASFALLGTGFALSFIAAVPALVPTGLYAAACIAGGWFILREAIEAARLRRLEIDGLMLLAAAGAAVLGEWAEAALLLALFSLGHALEHHAMGRARQAVSGLADLAPATAERLRDGVVETVPAAALMRGDVLLIRPNARIPADAVVLRGETSVDQAPITGESQPADKRPVADAAAALANPAALAPENRVFAGTLNGAGAIEVAVSALSGETALARMIRLVRESEARPSPTQRFADRFERLYVPAVLAVVVLLLFAFLVRDESFGESFYRAMAVLVAASPCALAISTPAGVLSGIARGARAGVLIKGGAPLEGLARIRAVAFDKTGTLTEGRPRLTDVLTAPGVREDELLALAVAVEALSDHPLAVAVARDGRARLGAATALPAVEGVASVTGHGVTARRGDAEIRIGRDGFAAAAASLPASLREAIAALETTGRTVMVVARDGRALGALGLMDTPRAGARDAVGVLRAMGLAPLIMLSGDNVRVAAAVARDVGLDEARGGLLPEEKVAAVRALRAAQPVAMLGDGVNDAPALAQADIGIAMGAAGSAVALEAADVALMGDDLARLPEAFGLGRATVAVIRQNLVISLGMVAVLVPAAILGLNLGAAVLFHEGSTVAVVLNALRLLGWQARKAGGG